MRNRRVVCRLCTTMKHRAESKRNRALVVCHDRICTIQGVECRSRTKSRLGRKHSGKDVGNGDVRWSRERFDYRRGSPLSGRRSTSRRRLRVGNGDAGVGAGEANEAGAKQQHRLARTSQMARAGKNKRVCGLRVRTGALLAAQACLSSIHHGYFPIVWTRK